MHLSDIIDEFDISSIKLNASAVDVYLGLLFFERWTNWWNFSQDNSSPQSSEWDMGVICTAAH